MKWQYLAEVIEMESLGGFIGIEQGDDRALCPALGQAVSENAVTPED